MLIEPGVTELPVLLYTYTLIVFDVTYFTMLRVPLALGPNPVTPLGSLAKSSCTLSVVAAPVQVIACGVEDDAPNLVPDPIALPDAVSATWPLQMVCVSVPGEF